MHIKINHLISQLTQVICFTSVAQLEPRVKAILSAVPIILCLASFKSMTASYENKAVVSIIITCVLLK